MKEKDPFVIGIGEVLWDMLPDGKRCGGAPANVIYHLGQLGVRSAVVSAVGNDANGDELVDFLRGKGIDTSFIARNGLSTGTVGVTLQDGIPSYEIHCPAAWDAIPFCDSLKNVLPEVTAAVYGSLAQRDPRSRSTIKSILKALPDNCLKIFDINLRQEYYSKEMIQESLKLADVLKINDEELEVVARMFQLNGTREETLASLKQMWNLKYVILTLGASGSMLFDGVSFTTYPVAFCPKVEDTVGCGDSFLAAWCGAILKGESADSAMKAGTILSAKVAGQKGAMA